MIRDECKPVLLPAQNERAGPNPIRRTDPPRTVVAVALFVLLSTLLSYYLNIWQDEAYSLNSTSHGMVGGFKQGLGFEAQAPLYFALLGAWRELNASAFFARALSLLFSLGTLWATWLFARRYIPNVRPYIVVAAVAFNPFTVWASAEIRPYAASITFSAVLLWLFFRGFIDESSALEARIAYIFVAVVGTYTQYYVAFLLPAHLIALLALKRWQAVRRFCVYSTVFAIAIVPLLGVVPEQLRSYHAFSMAFRIPAYAMVTVLLGYPFPHNWIGTWAHHPLENGIYLAAASAPIVFVAIYLRNAGIIAKAALTIVGTLFLIYSVAIVIAHVHILIPRHTLIMLVPMLLALFAVMGDLKASRRQTALLLYLSAYAVFSVASLWTEFHGLSKAGDWRRVASFVSANVHPGDGVAIFNAEGALPFKYYFKKPIDIEAIPRPMSFDRFDEEAFVLHSSNDVIASFGRFQKVHDHTWLIETDACSPQYSFFGCKFLNEYVERHLKVRQVKRFNGATVFELDQRMSQRTAG